MVYNRQSLVIEARIGRLSERVTRSQKQDIVIYGKLRQIRTDSDPEFTSRYYEEWCEANDIKMFVVYKARQA